MSEPLDRLDILDVKIEVGDIILSAPLSGRNGNVGRVEKISDTGRITIKTKASRSIYAYERGAPDVDVETYRYVTDNSQPTDRWGRRPYIKEAYTYKAKDYTVVGHKNYWRKGQAAEYHVLILKKASTGVTTQAFVDATAIDFDAEVPADE